MFLKRATQKLTLMFYERVILGSKVFFFLFVIDMEEILNVANTKKKKNLVVTFSYFKLWCRRKNVF